jgi:hypothetical protein
VDKVAEGQKVAVAVRSPERRLPAGRCGGLPARAAKNDRGGAGRRRTGRQGCRRSGAAALRVTAITPAFAVARIDGDWHGSPLSAICRADTVPTIN